VDVRVLAGMVTPAEALPELQLTVFGNPERTGDAEKVQVVSPVTDAKSVTEPPAWGSIGGVAVNELMDGADGPATTTLTGVALPSLTPPPTV
jgi:hypothetical protein